MNALKDMSLVTRAHKWTSHPLRVVSRLFTLPSSSTPATPTMDALSYREPPTESSVSEARRALQAQRQELSQLSERITSAEDSLAQIVADRKRAIREMQCEQHALEEKVKLTLAYISPIRRLPHELLRHIFTFNFDNHPCCAWILASVCVLWRRLALSIPKLWSKVSGSFSMKHIGSGCASYSHIHIGARICFSMEKRVFHHTFRN